MPPKDPAERITIVSMITTTAMGTLELLASMFFGSIAFAAAGIDALFDTTTSMGVLAGLRVSKRRADITHPYGHRQAETLASIALAAALVLAGIRVAYSAVEKLRFGAEIEAPIELFLLAVFAAPILAVLASRKIKTGRRTGNLSVVADGYHTLTDSASVLAVLVGLTFVRLGRPQADAVIAIGISALILWWGVKVGRRAIDTLMEASPGPKVMAEIRRTCREVPGVLDCHRCRARQVGSHIFADLHVLVHPEISVGNAHKIATKIERRLKAKVKNMESVVVHIEPHEEKSRD